MPAGMAAILARPWTWFFLMAVVTAAASAGLGRSDTISLTVHYLPRIAIVAALSGAAWRAFDFFAGKRASSLGWLGWISFGMQAAAVALAAASIAVDARGMSAGLSFEVSRDAPFPWLLAGATAMIWSGWLAGTSLAPLLPATILAALRRLR